VSDPAKNSKRFAQRDPTVLTALWGILWGIALGTWVLAPLIIESHHIRPDGSLQWVVLLFGLALIFACIGAYVSFIGGLALAVTERMLWGAFRDRAWAYGLFTGAVVVLAYTSLGLIIHWVSFRSLDFAQFRGHFIAVGSFCLILTGVCVALYRWVTMRASRPPPAILAWTLAAIAASGAVSPVIGRPNPPRHPVGSLERLTSRSPDPPLLFIGVDGATWRVLDRAIQEGSAPTLRELVNRGTTGTVEALWPPHWSGAAWAAILTGLPREVTGIYEDLAAIGPGLPIMQVPLARDLRLNPFYTVRAVLAARGLIRFTPPPRALLRGKPVWQLLHEASVDTAVVRFRFTYPPEGQASIVVSDWLGHDQWESLGVKREPTPDTVTPHALAVELLAPFRSAEPSDPTLFTRLLPGPTPPKPADSLLDPIQELRIASDIDNRTWEVSEAILRRKPTQSFLAVYIGGLDSVEHAFWPYRFPGDFPVDSPAQADIERLGPVLDRYVTYFDQRLNRLLALYSTTPNIVIVSDHGMGRTTLATSWRGWHTKDGIFLAAGPSVPHRPQRIDVSYYDVVPTIAALKGFRHSKSLSGHSVID